VSNVPQIFDSELDQMRPATQDDIDRVYSNSACHFIFRNLLDRVLREQDLGKRDRMVAAAMDAVDIVATGPRLVAIDGINLTETPAPMDQPEIKRTLEVCDQLIAEAKRAARRILEDAKAASLAFH
jgi:hypothetical protein